MKSTKQQQLLPKMTLREALLALDDSFDIAHHESARMSRPEVLQRLRGQIGRHSPRQALDALVLYGIMRLSRADEFSLTSVGRDALAEGSRMGAVGLSGLANRPEIFCAIEARFGTSRGKRAYALEYLRFRRIPENRAATLVDIYYENAQFVRDASKPEASPPSGRKAIPE